jgi:hypothetical protein
MPQMERGQGAAVLDIIRDRRGAEPEWDLVAESVDSRHTLVGEAWHARRPVSVAALRRAAAEIQARALPPGLGSGREVTRALFVPSAAPGAPRSMSGVTIVRSPA